MSAYYKISFGSGLAWARVFVMKTEEPTTNYGALVDCLIDYLVEQKDGAILDQSEYFWDAENNSLIHRLDHREVIESDMFTQGGNCGDVLMHYGMFDITEISESEINENVEKVIEVE